MSVNKEDRRVRKTKKALREGLAELLLEKNLRNITVMELCDKVDIHRATFYAHYSDIYALYEQLEDVVVSELGAIIRCNPHHTYDGMFNDIVDYIYDNARTCRMFLCKNENSRFYQRINTFLEEQYLEMLKYETGQNEISEKWYFLTRYHIQGCISILSRWVESNCAYPKEELSALFQKIDAHLDTIILEYKA